MACRHDGHKEDFCANFKLQYMEVRTNFYK